MYKLIWNGEVIEEDIETREDAEYLRGEYNMAFHTNTVTIRKM